MTESDHTAQTHAGKGAGFTQSTAFVIIVGLWFAALFGGGDMAELSPDTLGAAADRIWKAITHAPVELPGAPPIRVGCSVGGAILPGRAEDAESLVRAADEALMRAKEEGKNRIRFA